jgi:hypothetical protein
MNIVEPPVNRLVRSRTIVAWTRRAGHAHRHSCLVRQRRCGLPERSTHAQTGRRGRWGKDMAARTPQPRGARQQRAPDDLAVRSSSARPGEVRVVRRTMKPLGGRRRSDSSSTGVAQFRRRAAASPVELLAAESRSSQAIATGSLAETGCSHGRRPCLVERETAVHSGQAGRRASTACPQVLTESPIQLRPAARSSTRVAMPQPRGEDESNAASTRKLRVGTRPQ